MNNQLHHHHSQSRGWRLCFPGKKKTKKKKKRETHKATRTKEKRNSREGISLGVDDGGIPFSEVVRPFL